MLNSRSIFGCEGNGADLFQIAQIKRRPPLNKSIMVQATFKMDHSVQSQMELLALLLSCDHISLVQSVL